MSISKIKGECDQHIVGTQCQINEHLHENSTQMVFPFC